MPLRKILFLACLFIVVVILAAGFILAEQWIIAPATLLPAIAMLLAIRYLKTWLTSIALLTFVGLAAIGVLLDAPPILMLFAAIFALAAWDLALWDLSVQGQISHQVQLLENKHYQSLLLVIILGSLVVGAGQFLHLRVPFLVILFLALVAFYGLDKISRNFSSKV
jgi:hypothetical protein